MAFNVEKVKTYGGNTQVSTRGGFNIEKVQAYGQPKVGVDTAPVSVQDALNSVKQRRFDETSVRLPSWLGIRRRG